jgi:hypothetical protein
MNGAAIRDGTLFRLLLESDAEAAFAVHLAATRLLRNDLVRRESLDFIRDQINDGFVIGGYQIPRLITLQIFLSWIPPVARSFASLMELPFTRSGNRAGYIMR